MGFNATIMFCTDAWREAQKDPKGFVDKITEGMNRVEVYKPWDFGLGNHCNGFTVISNQHADVTTLIAVGGNCASVLSYEGFTFHSSEDGQEKLLRALADKLGFRVSRKVRQPKPVKK